MTIRLTWIDGRVRKIECVGVFERKGYLHIRLSKTYPNRYKLIPLERVKEWVEV